MTTAQVADVSSQLPECGYKELFHRQPYQDLTNSELPERVNIHHKDGNPVNNMAKNLEPLPRSYHRRLHRQQKQKNWC